MLFSKKNKNNYISAPVRGSIVPIEKVNDPGFSQKMMGEGFAVIPEEDIVRAPIDGVIELTDGMLHAFCMIGSAGEELLVHVGVDTVKLNGRGFKLLVSHGKKVKRGTPVIEFDRKLVADEGFDNIVIVAFSNFDEFELEKLMTEGEQVLHYRSKQI